MEIIVVVAQSSVFGLNTSLMPLFLLRSNTRTNTAVKLPGCPETYKPNVTVQWEAALTAR